MRDRAKMIGPSAKIILPMVVLALAFVACSALSAHSQESENVARDAVLEEGFTLLRAGNYGQAVDAFKRAGRLSKNASPEAYRGLAQAFVGLGKYKDAVKSCKKAVALSPDAQFEAEVRTLTGVALQAWADTGKASRSRWDRLRDAESEFRKAIELSPRLAIAHFNLGLKLSRDWPNPEAFVELEKYLDLDPQGPEANRAREIIDNPPVVISQKELQSKRIVFVAPIFPPDAYRARINGTVNIAVLIDEEGAVDKMRVLSGHPLLVQEAIRVIQKWRYEPALRGGVAVRVISEIEIVFR